MDVPARLETFPGIPAVVEEILDYLGPADIALLGATTIWLRDYALSDKRWAKFYFVEFGRQAVRGVCDGGLPMAALYSRRLLRRQLKSETPTVRRLDMDLVKPMQAESPMKPFHAVSGVAVSHRSRSRGESLDSGGVVARVHDGGAGAGSNCNGGDADDRCTGPGEWGAGEAGAMRFVHIARPHIAIGTTDQGCIAAWLLNPKRAAGIPPSAQGDAFGTALEAKQRRDIKRKYTMQGRKENKLVFFKIQAAANRGSVTQKGNKDHGQGSVPALAIGSDFGAFSMWGEAGEASSKVVEPPTHSHLSRLGVASRLPSGSDGDAAEAETEVDASPLGSSEAESESSGAGAGPPISQPWLDWQSPEKDNAGGFNRSAGRKGKKGNRGGAPVSPSSSRVGDGQSDGPEGSDREGADIPLGTKNGKSVKAGHGPKLKGKDLWSVADRSKLEEKQARLNERARAKAEAKEAQDRERDKARSLIPGQGSAGAEEGVGVPWDGACVGKEGEGTVVGVENAQLATVLCVPAVSGEGGQGHGRRNSPKVGSKDSPTASAGVRNKSCRAASPVSTRQGSDAFSREKEKGRGQDRGLPSMETLQAALLRGLGTGTEDEGDPLERSGDDHDYNTVINLAQGLSEDSQLKPSSLVRRGKKANRKAKEQEAYMALQAGKAKRKGAGTLSQQGGMQPAVRVFEHDSAEAEFTARLSPKSPTAGGPREEGNGSPKVGLSSSVIRPPLSPPLTSFTTALMHSARAPLGMPSPSPAHLILSSPGSGDGAGVVAHARDTLRKESQSHTGSGSSGPPSPTQAGGMGTAGLLTSMGDKPVGSKLRSDIWFASQWVRPEAPLLRHQQGQHVSFVPPVGSGQGLSYHAVVAFADGALGVLAPNPVSPKMHDPILVPASAGSEAVGASMADAQYLPPPRTRNALSLVPAWLQRCVTWLDRPQGEDRDPVSAVAVEQGRVFENASTAGHEEGGGLNNDAAPVPVVSSDREPDIILAAFGRVVGVWPYSTGMLPGTNAERSGKAEKRSGSLDLETGLWQTEEGDASVELSGRSSKKYDDLLPAAALSKSPVGKVTTRRKGKGAKDWTAVEGPVSPLTRRSVSHDEADPSASVVGPGPALTHDVDQSRPPHAVFRVHAHVVTALACNRRQRRAHLAHLPAGGATQGLKALGLQCDELTVASGDAGGDIVLWSASTTGKIASLQIARGIGHGHSVGRPAFSTLTPSSSSAFSVSREGVAVLRLHDEVIVAGGSEGSVAVWKRKFARLPNEAGSMLKAREVEMAPELILRESRAHSIVRAIAVPPPGVRLSAVVTGGGEGDVRLWPIPGMFSNWKQSKGSVHVHTGEAGDSSVTTLSSPDGAPAPSDYVPAPAPSTSVGSLCRVLKGHSARITGLHIDGVKIVSCALDGVAKVWDLQEHALGRNLASLRVPAGVELSSLHVSGGDVLLGAVDGSLHHFRFGREWDVRGAGEEGSVGSAGLLQAGGSGGIGSSSGQIAKGQGTGPNGGSTILDSILRGVVGGSVGSRKGGAEAAFGGRNSGGKRGANVQRRGMRDLRALVKVGGSLDDLGIEEELVEGGSITPLQLQLMYDTMFGPQRFGAE